MSKPIHLTRLATILVLGAFALAALPADAAGDDRPETLPFGPTTGTFHLHLAKDFQCSLAAAQMADAPYQGSFFYATNVAADACAKAVQDQQGATSVATADGGFRVHLLPVADQPVELVAGAPVTATIWLWTENVGSVAPTIRLDAPGWSTRVDTGSVAVTDVSLAPGGLIWHRVDVDLGPAPAAFGAGPVTLDIRLDNAPDDVDRVAGLRTGLGFAGDHKSSIALPLAVQVDEPGPVEPPSWPPALETASIRPGVQHVTAGAQCTTNFVFRDHGTGRLYMGTAAHCVDNVGVGGTSRIASIGSAPGIDARVVFSTWETPAVGSDFALMEIPVDREQDVHPAVIHFGGPTHLAVMPTVNALDKVITFGNSGLRPGPQQLDWHEGYVTGRNTWYTSVYTITPGIFGDSGSGIMTRDGGAIGAASTIEYAPVPGRNHFGNIPPVIQWMNANGWDLELQTWELLDPGVLPAPFG